MWTPAADAVRLQQLQQLRHVRTGCIRPVEAVPPHPQRVHGGCTAGKPCFLAKMGFGAQQVYGVEVVETVRDPF